MSIQPIFCRNTPGSFDFLPTEIQCQILEQLSGLKSLLALIYASPRYFQVYRAFKAPILSGIIRNTVPPDLLGIAVDAHEQREKYRGDKRRDPAAILAYVNDYFLEQKLPPLATSGTLPLETSIRLLRFHEIVEYFISEFAIDRFALINAKLISSKKSDADMPVVLSSVEHFRLARAFYHIELFGQLFFTASETSENNAAVSNQAEPFLQHLRDFELEELLCVRSYLIDKLIVYLRQMEDEFVHEYMEQELYRVEPRYAYSRWENDDRFFSIDGRRDLQNWMEDCLTIGLGALKAIFTANTMDERFYNLRHTFSPQGIWPAALNRLPRIVRPLIRSQNQKVFVQDGFDRGNSGWFRLLSNGHHPRESSNYADAVQGPRRCGYAIWDYDRMISLGLLTERTWDQMGSALRRRNVPGTSYRQSVEGRISDQVKRLKADGRLSLDSPRSRQLEYPTIGKRRDWESVDGDFYEYIAFHIQRES
ncbi:hypothetical protein FQN54_004400 [Arachnomyces sp. PD_36]|nr:hypothetical protein FQN54_004400 [Arachnomyces sp. PD_36]